MTVTRSRIAESVGMMMIGDAVLGLIQPRHHCLLWRGGARWWRQTVGWFANHPQETRAFAAAELAAGLWIALTQETGEMMRQPTRLAAGESGNDEAARID